MRVTATTDAPADTGADTLVVGVFDGEGIAHDVDGGALGALLESGEARTAFKHVALTHAAERRWLVVGLGPRERFGAERARTVAAVALDRAGELGVRSLCWELPHHVGDEVAAAIVEGTALAAYRFARYRPSAENGPAEVRDLVVSAHHDVSRPAREAALLADAQNRARDLVNRAPNDLTPQALGEHACALAAKLDGVSCEVHGAGFLADRGMGAFAAVAQGSPLEPAVIVMRSHPDGAGAPVLGLVGKAVTFDSGGLNLKPGARMHEMKSDMSGGAAVIEAVGAIMRLELGVPVVAVVGATENVVSGRSVRPGDVVTASNGVTIEVNNTDAEGRLVLADCLVLARELGAERLVDIATLTGGMVTALGSVYAGLMADDDAWAATVEQAGDASGELVWRMPLHPDYAEMLKGRYAEVANVAEQRGKASAVVAAEFLHRFTGGVPWAHLDIAGVANDAKRPYAKSGATGFGVRLLVEVARRMGP